MAEPLSITASVVGFVGLADVALRASKELCFSFSALKDAPREVKSLSIELADLNDVLADIQAFSLEYGQSRFSVKDGLKLERLIAALKTTQDDVAVLRKVLQPMEPSPSQRTVQQLKNRCQWVWKKEKLMRLREELNMHKFTLLATLFLCSQRNDIQVREKQHTIEQSLLGLHDSTARQYQALAMNLENGVQSSKDALGAIKMLEISNNHALETVRASVSGQMRTVAMDMQSIRQEHFALEQEIMTPNRSAAVAHEETNQEPEEVVAPVTTINVGEEKQNDWHLHLMDIDVESLTISILLTKETLRDTLYMMCSDKKQGDLAHENANVIWSEMNKLLASSLEASTSLANSRSRICFARPHNSPNAQASYHDLSDRTPSESHFRERSIDARNSQGLGTQPFRRARRTKYHLQMTPNGLLSIEMNCGVEDTGEHMTSARVVFIPTTKYCRVGFVAQLSRSLRDTTYPTLRRQLSIINITPNEKPLMGDWGTVLENDIISLQRPLSSKFATPFDHVDNDTTILWVCPRRLWRRIQRMVDNSSIGSQFFQSSPDIIIARCGSEVLSMVRGHRGPSEIRVS